MPTPTDPRVQYAPGPATDALLILWWKRLIADNELEQVFGPWALSLSAFFAMFAQHDLVLTFTYDEEGPKVATWTAPLLAGATISLWIRADARQSQATLAFIDEQLATALATYPVLVFATRHEGLLEMARRYGFESLGAVPYLFYGDTAYIAVATTFTHEAAYN